MSRDLEDRLYATRKIKTDELQLDALLPGIMESAAKKQAEMGGAGDGSAALRTKKEYRRTWRYVRLGIAVAAVFLIVMLGVDNTQRIVVEGKTYLTKGSKVVIDGIEYSTQQKDDNVQLILLDDNDYIIAPGEAKRENTTGVMIYPVGADMHDIRKHAAYEEGVYSVAPVTMYTMAPDLVVRQGPGVEYEEITTLFTGQCVVKLGMHNAWAIIEWEDGIAYVFDDYLFEAPEEMPAYYPIIKYATEVVNIREFPTSRDDSLIIGEVDRNEPVNCLGEIGKWTKVEYSGHTGYIFTQYLKPSTE
ncbi:SH3 domain-containing protein [Christensenellaceae bacterium OttesenSCG-928-M15]|nr:SH3 domain-containing protein [Christensenellaceae bacterium OttesenSCG-928-M15]